MLLNASGISKQFNGIYALKNIDLEIEQGEVHGLVGENGAGKSTLIKIFTGVYSMDTGSIFWNGRQVYIKNPKDSRRLGINVIHQDHTLVPSFNAVENIYLGMDYPMRHGRIDWKEMDRRVRQKANALGINLNYKISASAMGPSQRTMVEIVRSQMTDCRLLILDEPTSSLTGREAGILFSIIQKLRAAGTSILYVTHRMDEIFALTDRVTVFRNGANAGDVRTSQTSREKLVRMMAENFETVKVCRESSRGRVVFSARNISTKDGKVKDASFDVHRGEVLGIFGLGGSGRTALLESVYGYRPMKSGTVSINGKNAGSLSPYRSIRNGVVMISEDRRGKAIIGRMSVLSNITLSCIDSYQKGIMLDEKREKKEALEKAETLSIKMAGMGQAIRELSGGNQQKVVLARALMTDPAIFLCDDPTQAVDVMTRAQIHRLIRQKAVEGRAIVYVSSDLKEILELSDRIVIMSGGRTVRDLVNSHLTYEEVLSYCYEG